MAEIVNLRKVRKQRARVDAEQAATENRVRHGRTKAEKAADLRAQERPARELNGKRRD